jgi:hypothetical protein
MWLLFSDLPEHLFQLWLENATGHNPHIHIESFLSLHTLLPLGRSCPFWFYTRKLEQNPLCALDCTGGIRLSDVIMYALVHISLTAKQTSMNLM